MADILKGLGYILAFIGAIILALGMLTFIYWIFWLLAYPAIGRECIRENYVLDTQLESHSDWWGDKYKTTYIDGTQQTTGYKQPNDTVCTEYKVNFPW